MMEPLNDLARLRDSGFGQPWPRHGLKLLHWFANDCVSFDNNNVKLFKCNPAKGDFGFHYFENRNDDYGKKLLLYRHYPYYVVGNLNIKKYPKAKDLPEYVLKDKSSDQHNSNTDRIIVSLSKKRQFHRVYVTQHHDRSNYDPNATYMISRDLLMIIRRMRLEEFLEEMGYYTTNTVSSNSTAVTPSSIDSDDSESPETQTLISPTQNSSENQRKRQGFCESCCTIL